MGSSQFAAGPMEMVEAGMCHRMRSQCICCLDTKLTFLRSVTISKPAITAVPLVRERSPVNIRKAVVFPAPTENMSKEINHEI